MKDGLRLYPGHLRIIEILLELKPHSSLSYAEIAKKAKMLPESALSHLDILEEQELALSHFGKPAEEEPQRIQRCYEPTDKLRQTVQQLGEHLTSLAEKV